MEEFQEPSFEENENREPKRTPFLLTLCILTFIGSGFSFLYYLLLSLSKANMPEMMEVYRGMFKNAEMLDQMEIMLNFMASVPSWKYLLVALGFGGSIAGAALMTKLRKEGFHIYVISQIIIFALLAFLIGGPLKTSFSDILLTILFILMYFLQMKKSNVQL